MGSTLRDKEFTTGELSNLCNSDADEFSGLGDAISPAFTMPIRILLSLIMLYKLCGIAALACFFVTLIWVIILKQSQKIRKWLDKKKEKKRDKLSDLIHSTYNNIR